MCLTSKQARKQRELRDIVVDLVESLHLDERYPADDVAAKIEAVLEKALDDAGIPDPADFIGYEDSETVIKDWSLVTEGDLDGFLHKDDVEDWVNEETLGEYLKNDELDDALDTLDVAVGHDLKQFEPARDLVKRGFFGRLKWLFTGR